MARSQVPISGSGASSTKCTPPRRSSSTRTISSGTMRTISGWSFGTPSG